MWIWDTVQYSFIDIPIPISEIQTPPWPMYELIIPPSGLVDYTPDTSCRCPAIDRVSTFLRAIFE